MAPNLEARDARHNTPLLTAMEWGQHDTARYLVDQGAQVAVQDITGWTPVILAANTDDVAMLEFLLERGGTLDHHRNGWGPLNYAAHHGKKNMVRYLLDQGVDPNRVWDPKKKRMSLPIHSAAFMGHLDIVIMLLNAGAIAEARDGEGNTALDFILQQKRSRLGFSYLSDKPWEQIINALESPH